MHGFGTAPKLSRSLSPRTSVRGISLWGLIWVNSQGCERDQPAVGRSEVPQTGSSNFEAPVSPPRLLFRDAFVAIGASSSASNRSQLATPRCSPVEDILGNRRPRGVGDEPSLANKLCLSRVSSSQGTPGPPGIRNERTHDHLANIGLRDARQRIAHLLLELYVRIRHHFPVERGEIVQLPLSQGQIGQALGLTYVHVCRTLHTLSKQKILRLANHKLEIIDPTSLIAAAGVETDDLESLPYVGRNEPAPAAAISALARNSTLPTGSMPMQIECPTLSGRASASANLAIPGAKAA
jgi:hypothetical protein